MIKPKDMLKVSVFGPKTYMKSVIDTLYGLNVVHIEDHTKKAEDDVFDIGEPFEENERYAEILVKIRSMISNLGIKNDQAKENKTSFDIISKKANTLYSDSAALLREKEYYTQIATIYEKKEVEKALSQLNLYEEEGVDYSDFLYYIGFINADNETLRDQMDRMTKKFVLTSSSYRGITVTALFVEAKKKEKVDKLFENHNFSPIDTPVIKASFETKAKPAYRFIKLDREHDNAKTSLMKVKNRIEEFKKEHSEFLADSELRLRMESEKSESPLRFASTKNSFYIRGWVPKVNSKKLEESLNKITGGKVHIDLKKPDKKDNVPIAFDHPKIVEPFEAFMDLYTLPSYKEIDPTFFMFLTFPIFFGFMLGDVGYGLVVLGLFLALKKTMPGAKNFINAFIIASLVSIIFGMVFGEYFGYEEVSPGLGKMLGIHPEELVHGEETEIIYPIPHIFSRSHGIQELLSMSILFGIVHLFIGYIIGFINVWKAHGIKHAILEKVGWMIMFPGVIYLLTDFLGVVTGYIAVMLSVLVPPMPIMIGLAVLGLILIVIGEGARGVVELPALISNILSYARLMAVGLASLSLALVINDLAGQMFKSGVIGVISGILILILGHTINIALGILSPFLHSLRLHYVEFFTKFFHGGGRKYKSFGWR
ncbi:MAG: V-type ATP synthase subunit I [Candidatus Woesearchaeota archaeon]|nr:V-type ATP synthase subunit I [Candidatus Woesearchaeota archaeon]